MCAVLVGCGPSYYFQRHPVYFENLFVKSVRCKDTQCALSVTVRDCTAGSGILVTDVNLNNGPDLNISEGDASQTRTITWTIVTDGYEFAKEPFKYGMFIKSDPADEFKNARITGGGKSLSIDYKKAANSAGSYTYGLQLRSTTGNKDYCAVLDPWMVT
ncbi:MAG: hypothetical protein C5B46_08975 [Proteobacteria bacterium]|nr:MAG: hypothetical protein C5B46_08975 [Pseudomonadota bacterium]